MNNKIPDYISCSHDIYNKCSRCRTESGYEEIARQMKELLQDGGKFTPNKKKTIRLLIREIKKYRQNLHEQELTLFELEQSLKRKFEREYGQRA